ncbi:hypothetical protein ACNCW9_004818 [Escherichia coli]|uniref:Uncharacterized protein n=1 Tax=Escherichia coli TaxID=562 RepID=A0A0N8J468_ECOLX|nr:hypothetical protein [Escherichia coli]EER4144962.1 hypothetical protein [Escherichia coli O6]EES8446967.1 hypothetical protein [Escherichia coli O6:H34]EFB4120944.1 hypothetical protein [Escherichia coli O5]EHT2172968.1 hypothetical protein [Escherichia coli O168]ELP2947190.1 hypothetical protein [Escherichia coli O76]ELT1934590.1 hypothetical protein [Shigella sonnei]HBC2983288.1 hypothetical protein [Escherichia coli O146]HDQ6516931.1 hypothetical protein [Escherichia coli O22:H16]HD
MSKKPSVYLLLLTIIYCWVIFFLIGSVVLLIVNFWEGGCFYFSEKQFKAAITLSGIAGGGAGLRSWIFAWIDERKARKSPPSVPKA